MRRNICKERDVCEFSNRPTGGRSTLRSADVLVYEWVEGRHACMDLTEVSPLVGLTTKGFAVGHAPFKAASSRLVNHERARSDNQHVFIYLLHFTSLVS
jgi:hypothetical protein